MLVYKVQLLSPNLNLHFPFLLSCQGTTKSGSQSGSLLPAETIFRPLPLHRDLEQFRPGIGVMDQGALILGHGAESGGRWGRGPQSAEAGTVRLETNGLGHDGRVWRGKRGEWAVGWQWGPEITAER
jgi:hypothetical protein